MEEDTPVTPAAPWLSVAQTLRLRKASRWKKCWGGGLPLRWGRKACTAYTRLRTGRGCIGSWRHKIGKGSIDCQRCGEDEEGGEHRVFWCKEVERPRRTLEGEIDEREWTSWGEVEEWGKKDKAEGDVEKFFERVGG